MTWFFVWPSCYSHTHKGSASPGNFTRPGMPPPLFYRLTIIARATCKTYTVLKARLGPPFSPPIA
jgi:hypothetical protein